MKKRLIFYYVPLLLIALCLQLHSCQRDDGVSLDTQGSGESQAITQTVTADQIPHIIDFVKSQSNRTLSFTLNTSTDGINRSTENLVIGSLNTDQIQQITNSENKSNYTFTMEKEVPTDEMSVINYVVKENGDGYYSYFLELIPETNWLKQTVDPNDLSQFTGEIRVFDRKGLYINSNMFINGVSISQTSKAACEPVGDDPQDQQSDTGGNGGADGTPPTGDDPPGGNGDPTDTGNGGQDIECVIITITSCSCSGGPGQVITVSACNGQKNNAVRNPCDDECNAQNDCEFGFDANCNCLAEPDDPDNENEDVIIDISYLLDDCDTSKEDLKKIFPNATDTDMETLASVINDFGEDFDIDTQEKLWHFLSQAGHETGGFNNGIGAEESLYYTTADRLKTVYKKYFQQTETDTVGKRNPDDYLQNSSKVANYVYADRMGNGNEASEEGYKYRGRGMFQLTGKDNYTAFKTWYNDEYDPDKDFVESPELLKNNDTIAILSAMWFYKTNLLDKITVDSTTTVKNVTKKVNGGSNGLADRKERFTKAKDSITCQ